jgi:hypothetical protein
METMYHIAYSCMAIIKLYPHCPVDYDLNYKTIQRVLNHEFSKSIIYTNSLFPPKGQDQTL